MLLYEVRHWCALMGILALSALGCTGGARSTSGPARSHGAFRAAETVDPSDKLAPRGPTIYPRGEWRKARVTDLRQTALWLSHVLVRHAEVDNFDVPFNLTDWYSEQPRSARSREEALRIAWSLAERARRERNFDALAREFSEDPTTAGRGGSLGGIPALNLAPWPQVLDAVATLGTGDVSDVVETAFGYHVFLRRAPPPEETVSGAHIVIAHAHAPWLQTAARGSLPARSREEAIEIAWRIHEIAQREPSRFTELVRDYSEHKDAARDGDIGAWSTREPSDYPREVETLRGLAVGETSKPVETLFGVQVLHRTPNRPRPRYAAHILQFMFDPDAPDGSATSDVEVYRAATGVISQLREKPELFAELQAKYCCDVVLDIEQGRDAPSLEAALADLAPGDVANEPVRLGPAVYVIAKRLNQAVLPERRPIFYELPRAATP